jgi:hypothetical protein
VADLKDAATVADKLRNSASSLINIQFTRSFERRKKLMIFKIAVRKVEFQITAI